MDPTYQLEKKLCFRPPAGWVPLKRPEIPEAHFEVAKNPQLPDTEVAQFTKTRFESKQQAASTHKIIALYEA